MAEVVLELGAFVAPWLEIVQEEGWDPTELIMSPHSALGVLPLHAAPWGGKPLIEHWPMTQLPAATVAGPLLRRRKPLDGTALVVSGASSQLRGAEAEAVALCKRFQVARVPWVHLPTREATLARFLERTAEAGIVHLASHSSVDEELLSHSGTDLADGRLSALMVRYRARWERLRFVFLNSCDSGVGDARQADHFLTLVEASGPLGSDPG